ncbi:MAG: hypothetical protein O7F12_08320 [Nitrospirae bacterium]|nr:hypothetical protein [Nitrospirota bacterium]
MVTKHSHNSVTSPYPRLVLILVFSVTLLGSTAWGEPFFEDGYLGLTQDEIRAQLGIPHAVRSRMAALRVFHYYSFKDWQKYFRQLVSPEFGEDVYTYEREGIQVRYSFHFHPDLQEQIDFPTLYVSRVEVEFTPAVTIERIPLLVKEFIPSRESDAPAFRSNLWLLLFLGLPSPQAELIVKERDKEKWKWSLAVQLFSLKGLDNYLSPQTQIDRLEFSTQSLSLVRTNQRLTHEPTLNPYSPEFSIRPSSPPQLKKNIPLPQYED